jgi:hypothetical protein
MKQRHVTTSLLLLSVLVAVLLTPVAQPLADPILKPKKYHGPIPRKSFGLSIGFLGGPDNEQMYEYLDSQIDGPLKTRLQTTDFEGSPQIDAYYTVKLHPNFAFRLTGGVSFLTSDSKGLSLASEPDTTGLVPLLAFEREFDVILSSLQASGLYYFQDASVAEFQAYIGGGLSFFFPYAKFKQSATIAEQLPDGSIVDTGQPYSSGEETKFSAEPGIQGVLGALYHVRNNLAFFLEGRYQIGQSKFSLDLPTATAGIRSLNFDVSYSGFVLAIGASRFF